MMLISAAGLNEIIEFAVSLEISKTSGQDTQTGYCCIIKQNVAVGASSGLLLL
jgi:hypothetical protein